MGKLILNGIEYAGGPSIDDTNAAATKVYSSQKTQNLVEGTLGTDEYDTTHAYAAGDLCIYNNKIYKAKSSTTGNLPTDTTYWDETSISDLINTKQNSTDSSLNTTSKTIVGGINELSSQVNTLKYQRLFGNYSSFKFTVPNLTGTGTSYLRVVLVIGYQLYSIFSVAFANDKIEGIVNMGTVTISGTKTANSAEITLTLSTTSWGGIKVITFD